MTIGLAERIDSKHSTDVAPAPYRLSVVPSTRQQVFIPDDENGVSGFSSTPENALKTFQVAMISTALDLANRSSFAALHKYDVTLSVVDYLGIMKLALDFSNPPLRDESSPFAEIKATFTENGCTPHYLIETRHGVIIDPLTASDSAHRKIQNVFIGKASQHSLVRRFGLAEGVVRSGFCNRIEGAVEHALSSMVTQGHPRLVLPSLALQSEGLAREVAGFALEALKNSPYNERFKERRRGVAQNHFNRFSFIDNLHALRDGHGDLRALCGQIEKRSSLLCIRGWCGGTVLHEASETGNLQLVKFIVEKLKQHSDGGGIRDPRDGRVFSIEDILNFKNRDGSTALQLAQMNGHPAIVSLLLAAGSDPLVTNRIGEPALSCRLNTKRLNSDSMIHSAPEEFYWLANSAFAGVRFTREREFLANLNIRLCRGDRKWKAGDKELQLVSANIWRLGKEPVALSVLSVDPKNPERFWLSFLGVAKPRWRQGFGSEILQILKQSVSDYGGKRLLVQVSAAPEDESIRQFYAANGFQPVSGKLDSSDLNFVIMKIRIYQAKS